MKRIFTTVLSVIIAGAMAFGQMVADPNAPLQNDPEVRKGQLENGLTYYIRHNEKPADRADFWLVTNVGAIQETPAQSGLAHFLEHMALNGSKNFPGKSMIEYFQSIGVEFGRNINASTGVEQTMYMLNNVPLTRQGIIDTALLVMHDYSHFVTNDPVEIDKERGVIIEEWRTRRTADWRMFEKSLPYLYKGSKYADCNLIGSKENLETFPHEELVKFYKTWYRPDLQAVIVVGDVDVDAIESQIKSLFADIPAAENPEPKVMPLVPDNTEPIVGIITDPEASLTSVSLYLKYDPIPIEYRQTGMAYLVDLQNSIISSIINERLYDISQRPDAPFIQAYMYFGNFVDTKDAIQAGVISKEGEAVKAFTAFMTELERVKRYGFTDSEIERAKTNILSSLESAMNNAESRENDEFVYALANNFLENVPYMDPAYEYEVASAYLQFFNKQMLDQSTSQLDFANNAVIIYNSIEKEGLAHPSEAELASVITAVAGSEIEAPVEETFDEPLVDPATLKGSTVRKTSEGAFGTTVWELGNGITVTLKPTDFEKDRIRVEVITPGGKSLIPDEDINAVEDNIFMLYTYQGGLAGFPQTTLDKMLTGKVVNKTISLGNMTHGVSGICAPKDIETLMQLIYLSYAEPRFEESEFEASMAQLRAIIPNLINQPNFVFQREVYEKLYGNNPRRQLISEKTLEDFDYATLEKDYRLLFGNAAGSDVIIVGNFNPDEIRPLVEKYIGSLPVAKKAHKAINRHDGVVEGTFSHDAKMAMTTPKVTVGIFMSGEMEFNLQNKVRMDALMYVLDLNYTETIREEEGGTYGVGAFGQFIPKPDNRFLFQITFDTNPEKAALLLVLAKEGFKSMAENGPTQEQLSKAKENFLKNITENRHQNSYWLTTIGDFINFGTDTDTEYENAVNSLTAEDIKDFAASILDQGNEITLTLGPEE